ncbi:MAG: hypothetical protein JXQ72_05175 [Anaerolineae bacterium]|nr:hypothetical protein [Anaerolineae bacterium]
MSYQNHRSTLLLFDVDGVLIHPVGYKAALRDMVNTFAAEMGQPAIDLTFDEIAVFEACGLTNEWDSGAMCISALLLAAWEQRSNTVRATLRDTLTAIRAANLALPRPDFVGIAREIAQEIARETARHTSGQHHIPTALYLGLLEKRVEATALPPLRELLGDVYAIETPTTRAFQTYTLGHDLFHRTYQQSAPFESASYLEQHDIALLSDHSRERLAGWLHADGNGAVIYTARPSLPPADLSGDLSGDPLGYAPEGDLAARLLKLDGVLPLIGQGRVGWLALQNGRGAADYVKPSPVQALAAIGAAASGTERPALEAAAALVEQNQLLGPLAELAQRPIHVIVFEDSAGGIRAVRDAAARLKNAGLDVTCEGIGISPHANKRAALVDIADRVVDDVNVGLESVLN